MARMKGLIVFLPVVVVLLAGCGSSEGEKQWYKPNQDYTKADFERDRDACTDKKTKVLAEDCMQQRGWIALGADIGPAAKAPEPGRGSSSPKNKY